MEGSLKKVKWEWSLTHCARLVLCHIMGFLPVKDVLRLSETCKRMLSVSKEELLWEGLVRRDFGGLKRLIGDQRWRSVYQDERQVKWYFDTLMHGKYSVCDIFTRFTKIYGWLHKYLTRTEDAVFLMCRSALRRGVDPSVFDDQMLRNMVEFGSLKTVQLLLADSRVDPSTNFNGPLARAIQEQDFDIANLLFDDIRVRSKIEHPANLLYAALDCGQISSVRFVLKKFDSIIVSRSSPFHYPIMSGKYGIIELVLNAPCVSITFGKDSLLITDDKKMRKIIMDSMK